jgi:hypothetical protein
MFTEIPDFTPQNQGGATCTFCGQHARDMPDGRRARTFRTPTHIHMEGWIEICERCIVEAAVKVGMIPTAEAEELRALHEAAETHAEKLLHDLEDQRSTVRTLAQSLSVEAEEQAAKVKKSYDRGYEQALADAKAESAELIG